MFKYYLNIIFALCYRNDTRLITYLIKCVFFYIHISFCLSCIHISFCNFITFRFT